MNPFNRKQKTTLPNTTDTLKSQLQIEILKEQLTQSDYQIIKCYEYSLIGKESPYNMDELHNKRQEVRDKINELQGGDIR